MQLVAGLWVAQTIIPIKYPHNVHLTIVYLTHHILTSLILTLSVSLTGLVCCVEDVKKVSVLCLVLLSVNIVPIFLAGIAVVIYAENTGPLILTMFAYKMMPFMLPPVTVKLEL